jgi:ribonuclease VapC
MTENAAAGAVLDASAVLAYLLEEPGSERVEETLPGALLSAVNYAEVLARLWTTGRSSGGVRAQFEAIGLVLVPFDAAAAEGAAALFGPTRPAGLALGDRACLALALQRGVPAYTADRAWSVVDVGVEVVQLRGEPTR